MNAFSIQVFAEFPSPQRVFTLDVQLQSIDQRVVLCGPSGAGKSLLLKLIAGIHRPQRGQIQIGQHVLFDSATAIDLPPQQRRLGYVFQDYALFPHLTVAQNIGFGLQLGWRNPARHTKHINDAQKETVEDWLQRFHLNDVRDQLPQALSGGQRQRTALARALAPQPQALLLDEPFSALDPALRQELRHELDELQQRLQIPMMLITHDPEDAKAFSASTYLMRDGCIDSSATA